MRGRSSVAFFLPFFAVACTLVIDKDRFEDGGTGGGGGLATGSTGTSATTTSVATGSPASSSSTGISGTCVPTLFHVGFDEPTIDSWRPNVLNDDGADAGDLVSSPTRRGAGAWRIALGETQKYALLRSGALDEEHVSYWVGWSQLHEGPSITDGTEIFSLECPIGPPLYQVVLFALEMDPSTPNLPYFADGFIDDLLDDGGTGNDDLDGVSGDAVFADWAAHIRLSREADGLFELYRNGALVYSASGPTIAEECGSNFHVEFGLYRWQGFGDGGADMAPAQSLVEDEITLLKGPDAPFTDADALFTLSPDSGCFDAR